MIINIGEKEDNMTIESKNLVFVFGSNLAGRHGKGAAKYAREHYRAEYGVAEGPTGDAYAIPTKDESLKTLYLYKIGFALNRFTAYTRKNGNTIFLLTPIGCGLAGYDVDQIAPLVLKSQPGRNIRLTKSWWDHNERIAENLDSAIKNQTFKGVILDE